MHLSLQSWPNISFKILTKLFLMMFLLILIPFLTLEIGTGLICVIFYFWIANKFRWEASSWNGGAPAFVAFRESENQGIRKWPHYQLVVGSFVRTGVRSPFFGPKSLKLAVFGCQKMGLWTPKSENGHRFLSPSIPKNDGIDTCFTWTSFSGEFWANIENRII